MLYTTFALAHAAGACISSYRRMAKHLGGISKYGKDKPIPLDQVIEVCGVRDAFWALRCLSDPVPDSVRLMIAGFAERVLPIFEKRYPKDNRPRAAIQAVRDFVAGKITREQLRAAYAAAYAAYAAYEAAAAYTATAAYTGAYVAYTAAYAAYTAAYAAYTAVAYTATPAAAARAHADAAHAAAHAHAYAAAYAAEREWQKGKFLELLRKGG